MSTPAAEAGTVVAIHGIKATVLLHETGERLRCRPLRDRRRLAVGDRVTIERQRHGPRIVSLGERQGCLWRPVELGRSLLMAANVDRVVVVVAVAPPPRPGLIDRFLVGADAADIDVVIVVNKADLELLPLALEILEPYAELGYPFLEVSAHTGHGLDALADVVGTGLSVFAGHSGVGKSSILNQLVPGADLATGELSLATGKGRHTTSVTTCHELGAPWPDGALVVDTPGVRAFGLYGVELVDIAFGFRDLRPWRVRCHFRDCLHEDEPDCAVRDAVDAGEIDAGRYDGYLRILESVREGRG